MQRSTERILTTHVGSLPRAPELFTLLRASENGEDCDADALAAMVRTSVAEMVQRQTEIGIDVVNDGEHSKSSFSSYTARRLDGFSAVDEATESRGTTRDRLAFPGAYADHGAMCAARPLRQAMPRARRLWVCTGPVRYRGHADVAADIANLKAAMAGRPAAEGFVTALSPNNVAMYYPNRYYATEEEYYVALADAMREEYKAIVDAGFLVQIDDPRLATHYDRHPGMSIEECRHFIAGQVAYINHALRGIPADRVRFHTCYSTNVAPRVHDLELKHYVDLMLRIEAYGYSFEASNPRHEHEWQVWDECKLPDDKVLIPGVVSHCISLVEHPELVAQRIRRFAGLVGRERVIASNDCGFGTSSVGDEVHPEVAWAKLQALVDGARIASASLWGAQGRRQAAAG
jgi:5-methyltetrahydropteroyltriglutamate--homocysteine methyltransferase